MLKYNIKLRDARNMKLRNKIKLIAILTSIIILGLVIIGVTAQTISQNKQSCHNVNTSQNTDENSIGSTQDCHEWQNPSSCSGSAVKGCC